MVIDLHLVAIQNGRCHAAVVGDLVHVDGALHSVVAEVGAIRRVGGNCRCIRHIARKHRLAVGVESGALVTRDDELNCYLPSESQLSPIA